MKSKIYIAFFLLIPVNTVLFAEKGNIDFDGKIQVSGQVKTLSEQFPDNQDISPVFKTTSGMSKKVFKIAENGQEVEVLPEEVDGKGYYTFKPNEPFYDKVRCDADGGTWNFCIDYKFYPSYGGHQHTENIPPYSDWDNNPAPSPRCFYDLPVNTDIPVYYKAPAFATKAEHTISGWGDCGGQLYDTVDIKIGGLMSLPPAYQDSLHAGVTYYDLIGDTSFHPINHFGRRSTVTSLKQIAWNYYFEFSAAPLFPALSINDMSLIRGGLFDLKADWSPEPNGHHEHRYGNQVDVRRIIWVSSTAYVAMPDMQWKKLVEIACNFGVGVKPERKDGTLIDLLPVENWLKSTAPHFHLRFPIQEGVTENPPDVAPDLTECARFL